MKKKRKIHFLPIILIISLVCCIYSYTTLYKEILGSNAKETEKTKEKETSATTPQSTGETESHKDAVDTQEETYDFSKEIPKGQMQDMGYLEHAAFVGDSITSGLALYNSIGNATLVYYTSINPDTVLTEPVCETENGFVTFAEALEGKELDKIYIMLGTNGITWMDENHMVEQVEEFATQLQKQHESAKIIIESIPPFAYSKYQEDSTYDNDKVRKYNGLLLEMCEKNEFYYLDVYSIVVDESGDLPEDANSDGIHFNGTQYEKWVDYILSHPVGIEETV